MTDEIRFYRATGPHGFLSNLYPARLFFEGRWFDCAEQAYQFGKPQSQSVAEWLIAAPTFSLCAQAAHALLPWQVRPDWSREKVPRMQLILRAKFTQDGHTSELFAQLQATGDSPLIEESKTDAFWGIGRKGDGKNMLGILLMAQRAAKGDCSWLT